MLVYIYSSRFIYVCMYVCICRYIVIIITIYMCVWLFFLLNCRCGCEMVLERFLFIEEMSFILYSVIGC
jgi:hypothetical protein